MMSLEQFDKAANAFKAVLDINPTYTRAKFKLAVCLFETGEKQQALDQLNKSAAVDTNNIDLHKKIAKFTFPLWLYVAISGVIVYLMISPYY